MKFESIDNLLKCPVCGNPYNSYQVIGFLKGKVLVLVECWSGDLNKSMPAHIFLLKLKVPSRTRTLYKE